MPEGAEESEKEIKREKERESVTRCRKRETSGPRGSTHGLKEDEQEGLLGPLSLSLSSPDEE